MITSVARDRVEMETLKDVDVRRSDRSHEEEGEVGARRCEDG